MRFPKWAAGDDRLKVKFLIMLMALEADSNGRMTALAKHAEIPYESLMWAISNNVTSGMAEKLCKSVPDCGVRPHWLTNPAWIAFDKETGEITE